MNLETNTNINLIFAVNEEQITDTRTYKMAAEVGLLSRNIRIIGAEYPDIETEAFGARVLVGTYSYESEIYTGTHNL